MSLPTDTGIVTTTVASRAEARRMADLLLSEKLAACVQLLDIESHYVWKGERQAEPEILLLIKTRAGLFEEVIARIKAEHSYETPEITAQTFSAGSAPYLAWIAENTR